MTPRRTTETAPSETIPTESFRDASRVWWVLIVIAGFTLLTMMTLTVIDVFGRYVLNAPVRAAFELTELMMGIVVFAGLPLASVRQKHITISLLDPLFRGASVRIKAVALTVFSTAAIGYTSWRLWIEAAKLAEYGDYTNHLHIPRAPLAYFMAIMGALTCLALVGLAWEQMRGRSLPADGSPAKDI